MSDKPNNGEPLPAERDKAGIGNFHKTLKHDPATGLVDMGQFGPFDKATKTGESFNDLTRAVDASKLINPQAGWAREHLGPDPREMTMPPPPEVRSEASAVEMTELYWMALLRDVRVTDFETNDDVGKAVVELDALYNKYKSGFLKMDVALAGAQPKVGKDSIQSKGEDKVEITRKTLFRCGLPDEHIGPLVSQFFLNDIAYGTQIILQRQFPYKTGKDYLIEWGDWQRAQDTGKDEDGNDYPKDNTNPSPTVNKYYQDDYHTEGGLKRIGSMRDLARFVNKDALHQAYFNAALQLSNWGAPLSRGNPYNGKNGSITNQIPFGTLGGPHLLTIVSEVSNRALKVVWRQKWRQYLRHRPEAYGGLIEAIKNHGLKETLPDFVFNTEAARRIRSFAQKKGDNYLLPIAFSAGSPAHPAYGAGHATVAGACVTIIKAWFDLDGLTFAKLLATAKATDPVTGMAILPQGVDADTMTVEGELNKLAGNVAMGRSMGGVHWRTDNTRSLRLGEQIATIILRRQSGDYQEKPLWTYRNFDGNIVTIKEDGHVTVQNDSALETCYNDAAFDPLTRGGMAATLTS